jgi:DNA-binding IclR family transcriptional regulator
MDRPPPSPSRLPMPPKADPDRAGRKARPLLPDYAEGIQIKTADEDPRFNNVLARGLAILRAFQIDRKLLGNLEFAQLTGLSKATVSRLTYTLTQLGYLRYREEFGKYELAAGVVGLAYPYLANQSAPSIARPLMEDLAARTRTNVGFGVHEGMSVLYLEYALGAVEPNPFQRPGFRIPLVRTATGRACIAGMHQQGRQRLYEALRGQYKREWGPLLEQLEDAVTQVRTEGYCIASDTFERNVSSVAVPFVSADGEHVMAFNCQGSTSTLTPQALVRNGKLLLKLVQEVRRREGEAAAGPSLGHQARQVETRGPKR